MIDTSGLCIIMAVLRQNINRLWRITAGLLKRGSQNWLSLHDFKHEHPAVVAKTFIRGVTGFDRMPYAIFSFFL
jgi:hypothetical protein